MPSLNKDKVYPFPCCVYLLVFTLMFVVLKVNDVSMKDATHHVAVSALIANVPQIKLLVRHDRPPQGLQVHNVFTFNNVLM